MHEISKEEIMNFINGEWDKAAKAYGNAYDTNLPEVVITQAWADLTLWEDMETIAEEYFATREKAEVYNRMEKAELKPAKIDMVNSPNHYTAGQFEVIDVIKDWLTEEEFRGYIKGNLIKYIARERLKNGDEDIKKSIFYLNYLMYGIKSDGTPKKDSAIISGQIAALELE